MIPFLDDPEPHVRQAAARAAGILEVKAAAKQLLTLASDPDHATRGACLTLLWQLRESSAVEAAVASLPLPQAQLATIDYLSDFGGAEHSAALSAVTASSRSLDVLTAVVGALTNWRDREPADSPKRRELAESLADVQGQGGVVGDWRVIGPLERSVIPDLSSFDPKDQPAKAVITSGLDSRVELATEEKPDSVWLAVSELRFAEPTRLQFVASSNSPFQRWLNGTLVLQREQPGTFQPDSDRAETDISAGLSRIVVQLDATKPATFHVRFRPRSSSAEHERLTPFLLQNTGSAERGRELFLNAEKSLCMKCHRMNDLRPTGAPAQWVARPESSKGVGNASAADNAEVSKNATKATPFAKPQGVPPNNSAESQAVGTGVPTYGEIGPNLLGIGRRFSRIHIIESILEPSRMIAPSYETISLELVSGRVLNG